MRLLQLISFVFILFTPCCGNVQSYLQKKQTLSTEVLSDVNGQLISSSGSGTGLSKWQLFLADKKTGLGKLASVRADGAFSFKSIDPSQKYSMYLFNQDSQLSAVMGMQKQGSKSIYGGFWITDSQLPTLIFKGSSLDFSSRESISIDATSALVDENFNGIPDDFEAALGLNLFLSAEKSSSSIPTYLSEDDDQDGILDHYDADSNGNQIADIIENTIDDYRNNLVVFWSVSLEKRIALDASENIYLNHTVKLKDGFKPEQVRLKGPTSVLKDSWEESYDANGLLQAKLWEGLLYDDGLHYDRRSADGFYGNKLILKKILPRSLQSVFLEIDYKDENAETQTVALAHQIPYVTFGTLTASQDAAALITRAGTPFGDHTEYVWTVQIFDDQYNLVHASKELASSLLQYQPPAQVGATGQTYYYKIIATSVQRILGLPELIFHSAYYNFL